MGGLSSLASQAFQAISAVNTVVGAVDKFTNSSTQRDTDSQAINDARYQAELAKAASDKAQIQFDAQTAENERRDALRRAVAKQKAAFGATGADMTTGSGQAVLLGLYDESEAEKEKREALDTFKLNAIDQNVALAQRVNTLQKTQLKQKSGISNASNLFGSLNDVGRIDTGKLFKD